MSQQQDLPESANTQLEIDINFISFRDQEYIKEDLATTLEELKDEEKIFQYSLRIAGTRRDRISRSTFWDSLADFVSILDLGKVAIQLTTEITKGIADNILH